MTATDAALAGSPSLSVMARIEARRFARHPIFLTGVVLTYGLMGVIFALDDSPAATDTLSTPVLPAFFIGLTSLLTAARLTRSTEAAAEALGSAPGTEARRTLAVGVACLVPFAAGLVWLVEALVIFEIQGVAAQDWWFHNLPDWQVWSILIALGPVACLGGGALGVLTGRWLGFPGAPAVVLIATVAVCIGLNALTETGSAATGNFRLLAPWALFHSGTMEDGTQIVYSGNPLFYGVYQLCLAGAAVLVAMWHDRAAFTVRLRRTIAAVVVVGLVALAGAMTTGIEDGMVSDPVPWQIED